MREILEAIYTYPWAFAGLAFLVLASLAIIGDTIVGRGKCNCNGGNA